MMGLYGAENDQLVGCKQIRALEKKIKQFKTFSTTKLKAIAPIYYSNVTPPSVCYLASCKPKLRIHKYTNLIQFQY